MFVPDLAATAEAAGSRPAGGRWRSGLKLATDYSSLLDSPIKERGEAGTAEGGKLRFGGNTFRWNLKRYLFDFKCSNSWCLVGLIGKISLAKV